MTKLHVAISVLAALFSLPALADQTWWIIHHDLVIDRTGKVDIGTYSCGQTIKGNPWASPAERYEDIKLTTSHDAKIIDKGDEVDVDDDVFYRTEEACLKVIKPANTVAAAKAAADAAAKAKEDKYLEKYR